MCDSLALDHARQRDDPLRDRQQLTNLRPGPRRVARAARVFSWLIRESYDDKGNAILYECAAETTTAPIDGRRTRATASSPLTGTSDGSSTATVSPGWCSRIWRW